MDLIRCFAADSITDTSTGLSTVLSHDTTSECYQWKTTAVFFFFTIEFILWTEMMFFRYFREEQNILRL